MSCVHCAQQLQQATSPFQGTLSDEATLRRTVSFSCLILSTSPRALFPLGVGEFCVHVFMCYTVSSPPLRNRWSPRSPQKAPLLTGFGVRVTEPLSIEETLLEGTEASSTPLSQPPPGLWATWVYLNVIFYTHGRQHKHNTLSVSGRSCQPAAQGTSVSRRDAGICLSVFRIVE